MKAKGSNKKVKWILGAVLGLFVCFSIHFYVATNDWNKGHTNWQLSRIDFKDSLNTEQAMTAMVAAKSVEGVTEAKYNPRFGTMVFAYSPGKVDPKKVYDKVMASGEYQASPYVVPEELLNGGCPVMSGSEFTQRLATYMFKVKAIF